MVFDGEYQLMIRHQMATQEPFTARGEPAVPCGAPNAASLQKYAASITKPAQCSLSPGAIHPAIWKWLSLILVDEELL